MNKMILFPLLALTWSIGGVSCAFAQGTAFLYQGRLTDGGSPANGAYDLQCVLFDAAANGTQVGNALTNTVTAANGLFTMQLDFGTNVFTGAARWLEIDVRTNGSASAYVVLAPRQVISSVPYAMRSLTATTADTATTATELGGVAANQYVLTNDSRLADSRPPNPGSTNYIQNSNTTQDGATFSIGGNASLGGQLFAGSGVLGNSSAGNAVVGIGGNSGVYGLGGNYGVSGQQNAIFGPGAGVYGTTDSGGAYGVYGLVNTGTTNAGVYGKSIAMNGSGVLGQADVGNFAYGVWGKAAQGSGVVGESTDGTGVYGKSASTSGNGVVGEANGSSSAFGVWGKSNSGSAVHGSSDTGRGVDGFASNGGVGVYGNNLGSNTKGYAGDFFGRVRVTGDLDVTGNLMVDGGALKVPGAGVGTSTTVFIHKAAGANISSYYTTIDNPFTNGDPNAILIVTRNQAYSALGSSVHSVAVNYSGQNKWIIMNTDLANMDDGSAFNVLVVKP